MATLVMALAIPGLAQTPAPSGSEALGIDTSPKTDAQLRAGYTSNVTSNVTSVNSQLATNPTPSASNITVDPYVRDANGNITYDANGQPVMKTQAQIDAERAALYAQATSTSGYTPPATNGADLASGAMDPGAVPDSWVTTPEASTTKGVTSAPAEAVGTANDPGNLGTGDPWGLDSGAALSITDGTPLINPSLVPDYGSGVDAVVGGSTAIATNVNDVDVIVIASPALCKCCGAPLHEEQLQIDCKKVTSIVGYGAIASSFSEDLCPDGGTRSTTETILTAWYSEIGYPPPVWHPEFYWGAQCQGMYYASTHYVCTTAGLAYMDDPGPGLVIPEDMLMWVDMHGGTLSYYSVTASANFPVLGTVKVCESGHRQDIPCGTTYPACVNTWGGTGGGGTGGGKIK